MAAKLWGSSEIDATVSDDGMDRNALGEQATFVEDSTGAARAGNGGWNARVMGGRRRRRSHKKSHKKSKVHRKKGRKSRRKSRRRKH